MEDLYSNHNHSALRSNVARISRITIGIGITLALVGLVHDRVAAPDLIQEFLAMRVLVAIFGMIVLTIMCTAWGTERICGLTFGWMLLPQIMIAYMMAVTGGGESPYTRGFIFAVIAATLFPILTLRQSIGLAVTTSALYLGALLIGTPSPAPLGQMLDKSSLHVITVIFMCGTARIFLSRTFTKLVRYENELSEKLKEVQKQLQDLAQMKALAVHQDKMLSMSHLVSGILHSINHPVNYGLMAINSSLGHPSVESRLELKESLVDVKKALTKIHSIASSLRRFSAPKGTNLSHIATSCDFANLVEAATHVMAEELKDINVVKEIPPDAKILCDEVAFLSVLTAILANAAEALQPTSRMNKYILIHAQVSGETVVVEISDNGGGIPEDTLTHVFDPFFTTDSTGKKLGLGLSIAYGEVVRHGGTLTAVSIVGEGTTMRLELPLDA